MRAILGTSLVLAAVLALGGCGQDSGPAPAAVPAESYGRIDITYPLDETLFPPDIAAPTFVWSTKQTMLSNGKSSCVSTTRTKCAGFR